MVIYGTLVLHCPVRLSISTPGAPAVGLHISFTAVCYQGCRRGNFGPERMRKILLCTDLDRTLIPNGPHVESPGVRDMFAAFVARDDVQLAYVIHGMD